MQIGVGAETSMAMNPSHFKSGTLSLDEYKARRDWATSQQLEM